MAIMNELSGHAVIGSKTLTGGKHETLLENTLYIILYSHGTWRPRTVDKQDKKVVSSRGSETLDLTKVERNSTGKLEPQQISTIFPRTRHTAHPGAARITHCRPVHSGSDTATISRNYP